jgi:hypothetical protein
MTFKKRKIGIFAIGSAIIWAAMILGCSLALTDTECYNEIQNILIGGFIAHLFLIWGPLTAMNKKRKL